MLGTLFLLIAGWYRSKIAAVAIVVISFAIQVALVIPDVSRNRQLLGLAAANPVATAAFVALELILFGVVFYFAGWSLRWLWDRRKRRPLPEAGNASE